MPRDYTRKTDRAAAENSMKSAISKCLKNNLSVSEAATQYGIKRTTLQSRLRTLLKTKSLDRIINNDSGDESEGNTTKDWLWGFMKRHTDLSLRKLESTSLSHSMAFNKPVIDEFFKKYTLVLQKHKFNAEQIWNLDETGITTIIRTVKIVSAKGTKQVEQIVSSKRGALVTFVKIVKAIGTPLPPIFVYPRIRNPSEYLSEGSPTGSIALESDFAASSVTDKPLDIDEQETSSTPEISYTELSTTQSKNCQRRTTSILINHQLQVKIAITASII
ncbi:hypothetical protein ILUMI_19604 [Ignelater luminosus]|uniref:HTH psq-type domain-containing protein n=1 Tax=Ignelater luminosus TaxID=2038154 RepID=A0A8K0CFW1_IGNLU|nr:hypothetical protein ILUMI_19604 [Ignelater luminosus]